MTQPFSDARLPEVLARVTYQLVALEYRRSKHDKPTPGQIISRVIRQVNAIGHQNLRMYATSMYYSVVTEKAISRKWLSEVTDRSRMGCDLRTSCFAAYKGTRRDPRVTNRGVGLRKASVLPDGFNALGPDCREEESYD